MFIMFGESRSIPLVSALSVLGVAIVRKATAHELSLIHGVLDCSHLAQHYRASVIATIPYGIYFLADLFASPD